MKTDLRAKNPIRHWIKVFLSTGALLFAVGLAVVSCGKISQPVSNINESDEDARANLEARLKKTEEVRFQIKVLRDAIKPVEAILSDITKALNAKVTIDGKPADQVQTYLDIIQRILREATEEIIEYKPDGSWVLERHLSLPLMGAHYQCPQSQVQIIGRRVDNSEQLWVNVRDCSPAQERRLLVHIKVHSGGLMDVVFHPETLAHLFWQDIQTNQCSVKIQSGKTEIHCKPIKIKTSSFSALVDPLDFVKDEKGTDAMIKILVKDKNGQFIAEAELEAHPGTQTRIVIRTK